MPAIELKTKRLVLREWKKSDLIPFAKMNNDPKVMEFFPSTLIKQESDKLVKKIQKEFQEEKFGLWAVEITDVAPFIGFIGLHNVSFSAHFTPAIEIGYRLAFKYWNKGYALEGAKAVVDYAFNTLDLKEIVSFTSTNNIRSIKLMKKLNMVNDPKDNFDHPKLSKNHPLSQHVLYRLKNTKIL